jgi:hypothetical protein
MERAADSERLQQVGMPLWVVATRGGEWNCFELVGSRCRPIVIGSAPDADIRVVDPSQAPVLCYFQREGDEIWLVPVGSANVIRVDAATVTRPMRLWRKCVVQVAGTSIDVRIREEPPTAPDHEVPTQRAESLPTPDARSGCATYDRPSDAPIGSEWLPSEYRERSPDLIGGVGSERFATIPVSRIISVEGSDSDASPPAEPRLRSARPLDSYSEPASAPAIDRRQAWDAAVPRAGQAFRQLPVVERVARPFESNGGELAPLGMLVQDNNEPPPSSTSPTVASVRNVAHGPARRLEQLGILTRRRPWLVTLGAILGAVSIAGTMHLGMRVAHLVRGTIEAPTSVAAAALMPTVTPFCGPVRTSVGAASTEPSSRSGACRWLPAIAPSSKALQAPSPP